MNIQSGPSPERRFRRRAVAGLTSVALTAGGLVCLGVATAAPAQAAEVAVDDASFVWGLNGYAQKGIFGPWSYNDLTGNVTQLVGSVSDPAAVQTEYVTAPVPATSMPASTPQKTPNAVKFTLGSGTADPATGAAELSWTGSYTVNAYPPQFNAPNEIYSDPELTVEADGSGELTMNFALGEGVDMGGNPTPAEDFGRLTLLEFSAGSDAATSIDSFRLTPDYQGVEVSFPEGEGTQDRSCTTAGGATGWWGSWPSAFVNTVPASVRPHFYSSGCAGNQDLKPPLPVDVDLGVESTPTVTVSDTSLLPNGAQEITVEGTGFDPAAATGTRPPLAGQPAGTYVVFGRFADVWKPSAGAPSSARKVVPTAQKWAVPAAQMETIGGAAAGAVELEADGSFSTTLVVEKAAADTLAETGNYGIYTYPGSGGAAPSYETATPIVFAKVTPGAKLSVPTTTFGKQATATATVTGESDPTGKVTVKEGSRTLGTATLAGGKASIKLPKSLTAGRHALTLSYPGDANTNARTATASLVVGKAASSLAAKLTKKPTSKAAGKTTLTASSPSGVRPTGKTTVKLRNAQGKVLRTVTATLRAGAVAVTLPKLAKGKYSLLLSYAGDGNHAKAASKTLTFTVTS